MASNKRQVKNDRLQVTDDKWQVTSDRWQVTCERWQDVNVKKFYFVQSTNCYDVQNIKK